MNAHTVSAGEVARRISAIGDLATPTGVAADVVTDERLLLLWVPSVVDVVEYAAHFGAAVRSTLGAVRTRFEYAGVTVSVYAASPYDGWTAALDAAALIDPDLS